LFIEEGKRTILGNQKKTFLSFIEVRTKS